MALVRGEGLVSRLGVSLQNQARKLGVYNRLKRLDHTLSRARHREQLPPLDPRLHGLFQGLRERGFVQCMLPDLGLPYAEAVRVADAQLEPLRAQAPAKGKDFLLVPDAQLLDAPAPYLFGLAEPMLDFAESYFELPVDYLGVNIKREVVNGELRGTRTFHFDPEDEHVLKLIVYLNDVDAGTGPFTCFDAQTSARLRAYYARKGGLALEAAPRLWPGTQWVDCTGPRLTLNVADTARCLHRATPPARRDRYSMTFSYLSRKAYLVFEDGKALQRAFVERWGHTLTPRQLACVSERPR